MNDFERELEDELHRIIDPMTTGTIPSRRVKDSGGTMNRILGGLGAAVSVKLLTGIAVAAAAVTLAAAATEVATTGSINPLNWGQQVKQQVSDCKASAARLGVHGIGQCVASFARQHGEAVSKAHSKGKSDNGSGNANGHAKDKSKTHGAGASNSHASTSGESTDQTVVLTHPVITPQP